MFLKMKKKMSATQQLSIMDYFHDLMSLESPVRILLSFYIQRMDVYITYGKPDINVQRVLKLTRALMSEKLNLFMRQKFKVTGILHDSIIR